MNPIELLYPLFKLQNSTNTMMYLVIIVLLWSFTLYVAKQLISSESEMKAFIAFLITILTIGISVSLTLNVIVPDNIKTDVKETSYQTVSTDWAEPAYLLRIHNLAQETTTVDVVKHDNKLVYVHKYVDKYDVDPETSKYASEYHKKSLVKLRVMPVTVTTQWHDIKEVHKDMYIIERTYKVEPDLKKFNQDVKKGY
jgi:hypothetical protein